MEQINLSKKEKACLEPFVDRKQAANAAFNKASEMLRDTEKELWQQIKKLWPNASRLDVPPDSDWTVIVYVKEDSK